MSATWISCGSVHACGVPATPTAAPRVEVERSPTDSVMIGDAIEVILLAVSGDRATLGVIAPPDVEVSRAEIHRGPGR
jgi:hypothetical protein